MVFAQGISPSGTNDNFMQEVVYVMFVILNVVKNLLLLFGIHEILRFAQEDKVIYFEVEVEV